MSVHLKIGGSTAARTINCPKWLELSEQVPIKEAGFAADEGNLYHDSLENYYQHGETFESQVGETKFKDLVFGEEHIRLAERARVAMDYVLDLYDITEFECEPFVQLEPGRIGGSIDLLGRSRCGRIVVVADYKFGARAVEVKGNKQLPFYGMCAKADPATKDMFEKAELIVFVIIQPKIYEDPQIDEQPIGVLDRFQEELEDALANPDRLKKGSHCSFCPCYPVCPEKKIKVPEMFKKLVAENLNK